MGGNMELSTINTRTMTSLEIADLTGKRHDHVMRDIRDMFLSINIDSPQFWGQYKDSTGRSLPMALLPKRECLILVSGYSTELRAKIIDRWQELENAPKDRTIMIAEALIMANQLLEEKDRYIAELEPKAQFTNELIEGTDKFRMDEVCNLLHTTIGRNKFFALLRADKILKADNSPHREYIDQGFFHVILKDTPIGKKTVTLVTGKGLYWLGQKYDHIRLKAI
jgi:phage regulator Rha-like protein